MIGFGVIGCGLIGTKRANSLDTNAKLVACADINIDRARKIANGVALAFENWQELLQLPQVEAVIIATRHDHLAEITRASILAGKHVLVEKPAARKASEIEPLIKLSKKSKIKVRTGFNHRYHRAILKAKNIVDSGALGGIMFMRARYGHGGRIGYEKEWRANPEISGGGELKDQGSHLTDLARWFFDQEFTDIQGFAHTYFWDMPVDDNGFLMLKTQDNKVALLHASCTEWKNLFSLEIYGTKGKLDVSGLGGSYGLEKLTWFKMLPEMGPPETTSWEFPMNDNSWSTELREFCDDINLDRDPKPGLIDALKTMLIIEQIYSRSGFDNCT